MEIRRIVAAYFSPTGNTEKLAKAMAQAIADSIEPSCESGDGANAPAVEFLDFTRPDARGTNYEFAKDDLLIIGLPVYAGRLPNKILPFVQSNLKGDGTLSLPFVCFGNRDFGDGISELVYEQRNTGFRPAAAAAFATQHAFATELAHGRPDDKDMEDAKALALGLWEAVRKAGGDSGSDNPSGPAEFADLTVEGNMPPGPYYRPLRADGEPAVFLKAKPVTYTEKCVRCGTCARVCSMGSIDPEDVTSVPGICIKCQACVTHCPAGAKYFDNPDFLSHKEMLETNYTDKKQNVIWPCKL